MSVSDDALLRSKQALKRYKEANDALRAATEARRYREAGISSDRLMAGMGFPPENPEWMRVHEDTLREARAMEAEAIQELAAAEEGLQEVTVVSKVEGLKLRFETRKLQATLSAGVLVGATTVTEVLLPPNPSHIYILWAAYGAFIVSLSGCISDMQRISIYVENLLTGGSPEVEDAGWCEKVSRTMMYVNQRSLAFGLALFVLFATLNLA